MTSVPLLDLRRQFEQIGPAIRDRMEEVLQSQNFILGTAVERFEAAMATYTGVPHAIGVASGTDALLLPLRVLELRPGDEVITSAFTFFATAGAIHNAGGRPVFVDIDPDTYNIDPDAIEAAVTPRTRAIVPVHLFGQMAPMDRILATARRHGLVVLEDAAQAIGARQRQGSEWRQAGHIGDAGAFSFFPSKNLGAFGDGGMVVTGDGEMARRVRRLRVHGGLKMYEHDEVGFNSRLDALQAAVLAAKLPYLDGWAAARRRNAAWYDARLEPLEAAELVVRPRVQAGNECIYNQYTLRVRDRDAVREYLTGRGIGTAVYYPRPLHLQPCFAALGYREGQLPHAERATREVLSLPVFPELREDEQVLVVAALESFYAVYGDNARRHVMTQV
jgi:dTDP-4-amino-4,6-dideoxygalactose transaminase